MRGTVVRQRRERMDHTTSRHVLEPRAYIVAKRTARVIELFESRPRRAGAPASSGSDPA